MREQGTTLLVLNAINKCWKTPIALPTLLDILHGNQTPREWEGHLGLLFTEVPIEGLDRFVAEHTIPVDALRDYYTKYIVSKGDRNLAFERWAN